MKNYSLLLLLAATLLASLGCAGPLNRARIHAETEQTLLKAGFQPLAVTEAQEIKLQNLPSKKISTLQRDGKIYYLYPDLKHHRILIGHGQEFAQYNKLVTEQLSPPSKANKEFARDWVESGVWDN